MTTYPMWSKKEAQKIQKKAYNYFLQGGSFEATEEEDKNPTKSGLRGGTYDFGVPIPW